MRETSELFSQLVRGQTMKRECDRTELSAGQDNPEGQWREKGFVCLRWKLSRFPEDTMLCSWGPHSDFSRSRITDKLLSFPILLFSLLLFPEDRRTKKLPTPRSKQLSQLFSSSILEISILPLSFLNCSLFSLFLQACFIILLPWFTLTIVSKKDPTKPKLTNPMFSSRKSFSSLFFPLRKEYKHLIINLKLTFSPLQLHVHSSIQSLHSPKTNIMRCMLFTNQQNHKHPLASTCDGLTEFCLFGRLSWWKFGERFRNE